MATLTLAPQTSRARPTTRSANLLSGPRYGLLTQPTVALSTWCPIGIKQVIGMTLRTLRCLGIAGWYCLSPQNVFSISHWFKMAWVRTRGIATQVVKLQALWNGPHKEFIGKAMGAVICSPWCLPSGEVPISLSVFCSRPEPARCIIPRWAVPVYVRPEPLVNRAHITRSLFFNALWSTHDKTPWFEIEAQCGSTEPLSSTRGLSSILSQDGAP